MNNSIQLQTNEQGILDYLRYAFTDKTTFLSEIMQNARRAGASYVKFNFNEDKLILTIEDDGCGINDLQKILTVADSGWNKEIIEADNPYGMGFMSALYAAKTIVIESLRNRVEFNTRDALSRHLFTIEATSFNQGTRISMHGIKLKDDCIKNRLTELAKGYPINVFYQGAALEQPDALRSKLKFTDTAIGQIHVVQWKDDINRGLEYGGRMFRVYLQGVCVAKSPGIFSRTENIIHLDSKQFYGRAPDRDTLIDESDALEKIQRMIKQLWRQRLENDVNHMDETAIAESYYPTLKKWGSLDLLNHLSVLPKDILLKADCYPIAFWEYEDGWLSNRKIISKQAVEDKQFKIVSFSEEMNSDEPFQHFMYAYLHRALIYKSDDLHIDHWLHEHIINLKSDDVDIELKGTVSSSTYTGHTIDKDVYFCSSYLLTGPLGDIHSDNKAVYFVDGFLLRPGYPCKEYVQESYQYRGLSGIIIVPLKTEDGEVVRQLDSFVDEYDTYLENDASEETLYFEEFLINNRLGGELILLKRLVSKLNLNSYQSLQGKSFLIEVLEEKYPTTFETIKIKLN